MGSAGLRIVEASEMEGGEFHIDPCITMAGR